MARTAPADWRRLEELFAEAVELPAGERRRFLARECAGEPRLLAELEALLAADSAKDDRLERAVAAGRRLAGTGAGTNGSGPRLLVRPERLPGPGTADRRIGPYRLTSELGRGGMSVVYEAWREDGFRRRVAVKLLHPGMDSREIVRRFATERQILAGLDHPNIARLYDGGTTDDGRPYFVMEAIDGLPIDRYCRENELDLAGRLRLVQAVCGAVHSAHQSLVVHRDLKPSNVLVTAAGEPKLLDFGIAKLLGPAAAGGPAAASAEPAPVQLTQTALRPMTPGWASPEQILGSAVTTASDVYALGVLLYVLVADRHPHRLPGLPTHEVERRIVERDPPPPSAVAERPEIARRLRGDLDNIVARAMAREPERRYGSAAQLAEDLERHLTGQPVVARPPTWRYRTALFLRRHRLGAAMAAAFLALLVAFAASTAVQSARLAAERDRAERAAALVVDFFSVADPGRGGTVTARELLDEGAVRVRRELAGQPVMQARLLEAIARAYRQLGLYASAERVLGEALALRRGSQGEEHPEVATVLDQLGVARALQGDFAGAEPLIARALVLRERLLEAPHRDLAASLNNLALVRHDRGDLRGAEPLYRRALEMERRLVAPGEVPDPTTASNLALLLYDRGRYLAAEHAFREVVRAREMLEGPDHADLATELGHLGRSLVAQGREAEAEPLLERALELALRHRGPDHPETARALHDLGGLRGGVEGREMLERALAVRRERLGEDHPETAASREALAELAALAAAGG